MDTTVTFFAGLRTGLNSGGKKSWGILIETGRTSPNSLSRAGEFIPFGSALSAVKSNYKLKDFTNHF